MKEIKKISASLLVASLLMSSVPVNALTKNETVYSKLNNDGSIKKTIVSEYLKNSDEKISDETNLKNILNLNGKEKYKLEGTNIVWDAKGKDIYYQGEIDKELPVSINISYKLDGKDISLKDLLGKKGKVEISLKYTNKELHDVNLNGKYEKLYTPFIVTMGTIINNENNSDIEVTNGKVVSNGKNSIVVAIASPGLYESLNIDTLKNFDTVNLSFDTTNFELSSIYSVVSSSLIDSNSLEVFNKLDTIYSKVDTLSSSSKKLVNGSNELLNGSKQLSEGVNSLNNGVKDVYSGSKKINETLSSNIALIENNAAIDDNTIYYIKNKAITEAENNYELQKEDIAKKAVDGIVQNKENIENSALAGLLENPVYVNYKNAIKIAEENGILTLITTRTESPTTPICLTEENINNMKNYKDAKTVVTIMEETTKAVAYKTAEAVAKSTALTTSKETMLATTSQVSEAVSKQVAESAQTKTVASLKELNQNIGLLTQGLGKLNEGSVSLLNGTNNLTSGIDTLVQGLAKFDSEGIDSITNLVNGDVKTMEEKIKALVKLGNAYNTFTMKNDNVDGETKFVLIVDAQKNQVIKEVKSNKKSKKETIIDKIKNIFSK